MPSGEFQVVDRIIKFPASIEVLDEVIRRDFPQ